MATVTFNLSEPYKRGTTNERQQRTEDGRSITSLLNPKPTSVVLVFIYDRNHKVKVTTIHKILASNWEFKKNRPKQQSGDYSIKDYLDKLESDVLNEYNKLESTGATWDKVSKHIRSFVKDNRSAIKFDEKSNKSLIGVFDDFIAGKKTSLKPKTIQKYNTLKKSLEEFQKKEGLTFFLDDIDMSWYDAYKDFLLSTGKNRYDDSDGRTNETVSKYIKNLKSFMRWSYERGYHKNDIYTRSAFESKQKKSKDIDIITLTKEELIKLHNADMGGNQRLQKVKDIGLFLIHTMQRWKDVHSIRVQDIDIDRKIWKFKAQKTGKETVIRFEGFFAKAWEILEKYNFQLPNMSDGEFNRTFKRVGRIAGINSYTEKRTKRGGEVLTDSGEKWKFMTSHVGRRTGVSLLANDGFPLTLLMEITQHDDINTLMRYVDDRAKEKQLIEAINTHTLNLFPTMKIAN